MFSESKEQFALVHAGTESTENVLADADGNFAHISLVRELGAYNWELLDFLNSNQTTTNTNADRNSLSTFGIIPF